MALSGEDLDRFDAGVIARVICVECGKNGVICACPDGPYAKPGEVVAAIAAEKAAWGL